MAQTTRENHHEQNPRFAVRLGRDRRRLGRCTTAQAEFGIGINVSNNGFGVQGRQTLSPSFDLRFGISGIAYGFDFEYDDIDYDVKQSLAIPEIALDWRPAQGMFRLTLSAAYYNNVQSMDAVTSPFYLYQIGGNYYTSTQMRRTGRQGSAGTPGRRTSGVGWDFMHGKKKGLDFNLDVGAYYRGEPDVTLSATGGGVSATDLAIEADNIKSDAWTFMPTVRLGMTFKF
ncbi:MAG: hypothetical protein MZV65_52550 [Chromatiales bacterium]|nr:hypothetical protein [Chromatiales bacterium]